MSGILDRLKTLYASTVGEGFAHHIETGEWDSSKPERRRLAASDAAAYIGVSLKTLQNWRFIGGGPPYLKINSRKTVYDTADLDQWLDERRFTSTADEAAREG